MLKNIGYFSLYNIMALVGIIALAEGILFIGTLGGALWAGFALYLRLKRSNQIPSKLSFMFLVIICSAISAALCVIFEIYIFNDNRHSFFSFLVVFIISLLLIFYTLNLIYSKENSDVGNI